MFFWGMISAFASSISGYLLFQSGEYDGNLGSWHQWMGISVAVISAVIYFGRRKYLPVKWQWLFSLLLLALVTVTGHLGGSLTHGPDYLTKAWENTSGDSLESAITRKPIPEVQEALVYNDIVQPIFESKCYRCHGPSKQKGRLRLDQPALIMKGGKEGKAITPGNAKESELVKRLLLPREDEHHMPPKEKSQLTDQQISLLHWWIDAGAGFSKKVKEIDQPEKIKPLLLGLQSGNEEKKQVSNVPVTPVEKANESDVEKLRSKGAIVMPVAASSNYLIVNFITASNIKDKDIQLLLPLTKQLIWLKMGNTVISDSALHVIGQCTSLTRLQLDHTGITDKGLSLLRSLTNLQSLNLVGTKVTAEGVLSLQHIKTLQSIYLYQANVNKGAWNDLKKAFPDAMIDSGGYVVPLLPTDTMVAK